jgi:[citrate (pro-3S)-lyase] ligase
VFLLFDFGSRVVSVLSGQERRQVISLAESRQLVFEEGADLTALVEDSEGSLAATASLFGNAIRMVAVSGERGLEGQAAVAVSSLMETSRASGAQQFFLYAKPQMALHFASLGFRSIAETDGDALLEIGEPGIGAYRDYLRENRLDAADGEKIGAVTAKCDPFTLGHGYLIERALERCGRLYVIVEEAAAARFPAADRLAMAEEWAAGLKAGTVKVIAGGRYVLPAELPGSPQKAKLGIDLFVRLFVPVLGIGVRFFGECPSSRKAEAYKYNGMMRDALRLAGVETAGIQMKRTPGGEALLASSVREMLSSGKIGEISLYLPDSTISYLKRVFPHEP